MSQKQMNESEKPKYEVPDWYYAWPLILFIGGLALAMLSVWILSMLKIIQ